MVSTPETGIDSVSISYAILGPVFAIYRPITAIASAIITGMLVATDNNGTSDKQVLPLSSVSKSSSCCATTNESNALASSSCRSSINDQHTQKKCCPSTNTQSSISTTFIGKTVSGIRYAATQLIDDLIVWLLIGLVFATLIRTFLPPSLLISYGSGLQAMLVMMIISIPMYICATASTPIAAGFIMAGISPGTALVFMMAGPATNISTLGVIKNEMGAGVLVRYLAGIGLCALAFGYLLDWGLVWFNIDISQQMQHSHQLLPYWFSLSCALLLALLAIKPLRKIWL